MSGLEIALVLGGLAAFAGAAVGMLALGGWDAADLGFSPPSGQRLTIGAYLLASHAVTAATLWQAPKIGSCLAASLGAGWLGAAAAGLIALAAAPANPAKRARAAAFRAAMGLALLAPLWAYVQLIRAATAGII
ncbi:hypothetical protein [Caulobacter sp. 17J80-11]|uniref:hypothetical protein n=1 Tax=Caulobacter sp. 17J80-11 TaxID=2763502 RepID=UPI001653625C|nr:hypothetical protein [Caulobacter sp. 17J80-11]MBC6982587.1 hypothetical protein [Caulobacter sp. 17J80-11]